MQACLQGEIALPLVAQESPLASPAIESAPEPGESSKPSSAVRHVGPDTFILLDEEGNPQPFLGMPYETFMKAWQDLQAAESEDSQGPRYTIDRMRIEGRALPTYAELVVRFEITVTTEAMTSVPLRLPQAILRSDRVATPDDPTLRITFDETRGGFVAWLQGKPNHGRTVTLNILAPLQQQGSETRLALTCPRGVPSSLVLDVAEEISNESGSLPSIVTRKPLPSGGIQLQAEGLAGEFELSWRRPDAPAAELAQVLRASGNLLVHIDGRSVRSEAQLSVESFGGPFDRFYVRLPRGAALVANEASESGNGLEELSVLPLGPNESPPGHPVADSEQWVLVRLATRQKGPIEITLQTEQPLGISESDLAAELGGFEVLGALRQFGDVNIVLDPNWQVDWDLGQFVRRIDTAEGSPPPSTEKRVATFQFDRQPWNLRAQITPLASYVQVVPHYQLVILPDEARLRVQLDYHIPGAPIFELKTDLRGWREVLPVIESGGLVESAVQTADGHLLLRLKKSAPENAQITFEARRDLPPSGSTSDGDLFGLPLPTPRVESVAPGELVVYSAPNLSLTFDKPQSSGLSSRNRNDTAPVPPELEGFQAQAFSTVLAEPTFAAKRSRRRRQISSSMVSEIRLRNELCQVEQTISYQVAFEPISQLRFEVPTQEGEIDPKMTFELLPDEVLGDNAVQSGEAPLGSGSDSAEMSIPLKAANPTEADALSVEAVQTVRLQLPQPRMGHFRIRLRYQSERQTATQSPNDRWAVPLAVPLEGQLANHRARVAAESGKTVSLALHDSADSTKSTMANSPWHVDRSSLSQVGKLLVVNSTEPSSMLPLAIATGNGVSAGSTIVQEMWFQTWVSQRQQQNRAVFRFDTKQEAIAVELPPAIFSTDQWMLLLDGQPLSISLPKSGPLSVPIPLSPSSTTTPSTAHTLEVIYREPITQGLITSLQTTTPPLLVSGAAPSHVVWQYVLPSDQYLLSSPPYFGLVNLGANPGADRATNRSFWQGWFGNRNPSLGQVDLEQRLGASTRVAPSQSENKYVFTGFSPNGTLQLVTARRWVLVLTGSLAALAIGLLLLYVPALSNARSLAVVAASVGVFSLCFPWLAVAAAKLSALGILLAAVAGLFKFFGPSSSARNAHFSGSSTVTSQPIRSVSRAYTPAPVVSRSGAVSSVSVQTSDPNS